MASHWISYPASPLLGDIEVPGDKSISHRALILGSIAQGPTMITGLLTGEDCLATRRALEGMGVRIEQDTENQIIIHGVGKRGLQAPQHEIDCGNSGTTMRLLSGLLAGQSFDSQLKGDRSLMNRPMQRISVPLTAMGANIKTTHGKAPLLIKGNPGLQGIHYSLPEASAQVKSCLLLAGLYAKGGMQIVEPMATRDHTERMLMRFSYPIEKKEHTLFITAENECIGTAIKIPGDLSSAAFFIVAATLIPGSRLCIRKVGINATRSGIISLLNQMGASIRIMNPCYWGNEEVADLEICYAPLHGINIAAEHVVAAIDEFPVLLIAAASASGVTRIQGAQELRVKESDRIMAMVQGLTRLGIKAEALPDGAQICGGTIKGGSVSGFNDHRIVMAFAVAGAISESPIKINGSTSVATSFPNFISLSRQLDWQIQEWHDESA